MCWECWSEGVEPSKWAHTHVKLDTTNASRQAPCQLTAAAVLPLTPRETFELLTHPENAAIFKGIDRCTYRRILADDGDGLQEIEVENESEWQFAVFRGRVRTRLNVRQDASAGVFEFSLAPGHGGPMQQLDACWTVHPAERGLASADGFVPEGCPGLDGGRCCLVTLEQSVRARGVPPFLNGAFTAFAASQIRRTFEDVFAEACNIRRGAPSLAPYHTVANKQILPEGEEPSSVLALYELMSQNSSGGEEGSSGEGGGPGGAPSECGSLDGVWAGVPRRAAAPPGLDLSSERASVSSIASSSLMEPASHPLQLGLCTAAELDLGAGPQAEGGGGTAAAAGGPPASPRQQQARLPAGPTEVLACPIRAFGELLRQFALATGILDEEEEPASGGPIWSENMQDLFYSPPHAGDGCPGPGDSPGGDAASDDSAGAPLSALRQ